MAADPELAADPASRSSSAAAAADFRQMVSVLHSRNIEVLLEVSRSSCCCCCCRCGGHPQAVHLCASVGIGCAQPIPPALFATPLQPSALSCARSCPQFELTFTAEGTDNHPTSLSLRGLDYSTYYRRNGVRREMGLRGEILGD